ncbi:MAG: endonuclease MutS2 [Limnochordia bacterium]|nr:endonuclease MutS2 [Limnochordia bacterium]
MYEHTLKVLEFAKVQNALAGHCLSSLGQDLCEELRPLSDKEQIRSLLAETEAAIRLSREQGGSIPLRGLKDIREPLRRAKVGAMLSPEELADIQSDLQVMRLMRRFLLKVGEEDTELWCLCQWAEQITPNARLEERIGQCIDENCKIKDSASSALRTIRRQIQTTQNQVKSRLQEIVHSGRYQKMLQDGIVTMRAGRYVVPVKQEYKDALPGIIHDLSSSGATVFIEPEVVVRLNNELRRLINAEEAEVKRILRELSNEVGYFAEEAMVSLEALGHLDFTFAKARYSALLDASCPEIVDDYRVEIRGARHPLLGKDVVANDLYLGEGYRALVITGPNTGGKTVVLKTFGLLCLMVQCGLPIPADPGSVVPVFEHIFADIGDEQSIEQSLSTFSGHMRNIIKILDQVTPGSLVLLDELGAGTDPDEGSALAMAILEHLVEKCLVVATTHYSQLKGFAFHHSLMENACVEFDTQTLKPTYRLMIGLPGKSNAFQIALGLGLEQEIHQKALRFRSEEDFALDELIESIQLRERQARSSAMQAELEEKSYAKLRQEYDERLRQLNSEKNQIIRNAEREAKQMIRQTRQEFEDLLGRMRKVKDKEELEDVALQVRMQLEEKEKELEEREGQQKKKVPHDPLWQENLRCGDSVFIRSLQQQGTLLEAPKQGQVQVQVGIMKVVVDGNDLAPAQENSEETSGLTRTKSGMGKLVRSKSSTISQEVHLRGMTVDEAIYALDKYLDDVMLAGLSPVRIVHGKGAGILRKAIGDYLRTHAGVKDYHIAPPAEGGFGVTVVHLQ